jgi:hypothetical protein
MWFRRRRKRARLDLSALDRLSELVERIVTLLPTDGETDLAAAPPAEAVEERPAPVAVPEPALAAAVLFVPSPAGYRVLETDAAPPPAGARVELPDGAYRVLRLGASPFPGDTRPCAFLEREEPRAPDRTSDA